MKSRIQRYSARKGFSLIELAMIIAIIAILASFAVVSFGNLDEERDARMVQAAQATLQSIVSEGAARLDIRPADFQDAQYQAVLLAAQASIGQKLNSNQGDVRLSRSGNNYTLTIDSSGRQAVFRITNTGTVKLERVDKFASYVASSDGVIQKGP